MRRKRRRDSGSAVRGLLIVFGMLVLVLLTMLELNLDSLPVLARQLDSAANRAVKSIKTLVQPDSDEKLPLFPSLTQFMSTSDSGGATVSLAFPYDSIEASAGMSVEPQLIREPSDAGDRLEISCSDIKVVRVTENGLIALREGTATVTVTAGAASASLTVNVKNDCVSRVKSCVSKLMTEAGGEGVLLTARGLCEDMSRSQQDEAQALSDLMNELIAYADGEGNAARLNNAAEGAKPLGFKKKDIKRAAVGCWAAGQRERDGLVLSFAGDCTLAQYNGQDRTSQFPYVYKKSGSLTYPFDNVRTVFSADSYSFVNFEGTLTKNTGHQRKNYYFRGKPEYAEILPASFIEGVTLANNHSRDYYDSGYEDTVENLARYGVDSVGKGGTLIKELPCGSTVVRVVYLAGTSISAYSKSSIDSLCKQVGEYKSEGIIVIVNLHWGYERETKPRDWQIDAAHSLIDAGADLVIGHHSHVLQGIELYKGGCIVYSLGNFAFGGNSSARLPETMIFRASFGFENGAAELTGISAVPCYTTSTGTKQNNYQPALCMGEDGQKVIDLVLERSRKIGGIDKLEWHGVG